MTGVPPGEAADAVVEVVVVAVEELARPPGAGTGGRPRAGQPPWFGAVTPDVGGAACCPPLPDDSARATAPTTTSVAATATETMSHRSS
jgi:hypothetical protein